MDTRTTSPSNPTPVCDSVESRKHAKRVITAARKEQNRIAQRIFRQRQKERKTRQRQHSKADQMHEKPIDIQPYTNKIDSNISAKTNAQNNSILTQESNFNLSASGNSLAEECVYPTIEAPSCQPLLDERFLVDDVLKMQGSHNLDYLNMDDALLNIFDPSDPAFLPHSSDTAYSNTFESLLPSSTCFQQINHSLVQEMLLGGSLKDASSIISPRRTNLNVEEDGTTGSSGSSQRENLLISTSDNSDSTTLSPLSIKSRSNHINSRRASGLADPYLNVFQFSHMTILHICAQNAHCLGLTIADFYAENCLALNSPFYRPAAASDDPEALLAAISRPSIPKFLQPTLSQILFPHHPILDLLPIPSFRERAVMLSATSPALLNPIELKQDIMIGGLICWGSRHSSAQGGQGQPWDLRSWEAAPWFLEKWRLLVGGENGELWKQSMWWRNLRGEASGPSSLEAY